MVPPLRTLPDLASSPSTSCCCRAAHWLGPLAESDHSSNQTSSKRQPLKTLLTIILRPLTNVDTAAKAIAENHRHGDRCEGYIGERDRQKRHRALEEMICCIDPGRFL